MTNVQTSGGWVKWEDGETKNVRILSASPVSLLVHWFNGRTIPCSGPGCSMCTMGDRPKQRWSVQVQYDGDTMTWEMANMTWRTVEAISQELGGIHNLALKVIRNGTGRATRYTIIPLADQSQVDNTSDLAARVKYAKDLATTLGYDPAKALKDYLETASDDIKNADAFTQVNGFIEMLECAADAAEAASRKEEQPEADLLDMF